MGVRVPPLAPGTLERMAMVEELAGSGSAERKFTVHVADGGGCKRVLSIEIPSEELDKEKAAAMAELQRDLKVPGFRQGKVPRKYIEKNYKEAIHTDAVRNLLPDVYEGALVREGITPISEPKFDNVKTEEEGDTISFDVTVEVRPEVTIEGYRGLKVKMEKKEIKDSDVNDAVEHLRGVASERDVMPCIHGSQLSLSLFLSL